MSYPRDEYFLRTKGDPFWKLVTKEEWVRAERAAGFQPKCSSDDPSYWTEPATGSFSSESGKQGCVETTWLFRPRSRTSAVPFLIAGVIVMHEGDPHIRVVEPRELQVTHPVVVLSEMKHVWDDEEFGQPRRLSPEEIADMTAPREARRLPG